LPVSYETPWGLDQDGRSRGSFGGEDVIDFLIGDLFEGFDRHVAILASPFVVFFKQFRGDKTSDRGFF